MGLVSSQLDDVPSMGIIERDTRLVNEEPITALDRGSESLYESRGIPCRVLSDTKDNEELRLS